jgi:hypothetical protein
MSKLNLVEFKKFETLYEDEALTLYGQGSAGVWYWKALFILVIP